MALISCGVQSLSAMMRQPALRRPCGTQVSGNPAAATCLRNHVLKPAAWRWARRQPVHLKPGSLYKTIHEPYFFGYVDQQLVSHFGQQLVESGGLRVRTTIDPHLQKLAQQTIASHLPRKTDPASALVAIDPRNGKVRAMAIDV